MAEVSVARRIAASSEAVYDLVSDLPRMGEWSNENTGGRWVKGATGPAEGARFQGTNTNGKLKWKTMAKVTSADRGRRFAFSVTVGFMKVADWSYDIVADGDGCTVTETWVDRRNALDALVTGLVTGVRDRASFTRDGMAKTLEALAATAERA